MRYEYKYFVPYSKLDLLRKLVSPFMNVDKHAAQNDGNHYTVRSIYFDNQDFDFYVEKMDHIKHRKKVRLRGYDKGNADSRVFLEIKRKYEMPIMKNRAPLTFDQSLGIFENRYKVDDVVSNSKKFPNAVDDAKRFFYQINTLRLKPVVTVAYEREPFVEKVDTPNNLRVTFDKHLRSSPFPTVDQLYDEPRVKYSIEGFLILEVKFNQYYPSWMKPIIGVLGVRWQSASKYCISIDEHNLVNRYSKRSSFSQARFLNKKFS